MEVTSIQNGIIIDHVPAGTALKVLEYLKIDPSKTKLALIQKVHQDSLESAIVRYMAKEALPEYYAAILKNPNCIDRLVEGIFYKVCKMQNAQKDKHRQRTHIRGKAAGNGGKAPQRGKPHGAGGG